MEKEDIEVYVIKADGTRDLDVPVCSLKPGGELPAIGDVLVVSGATSSATSLYRVVDREHTYNGKGDGSAVRYGKSWIHVRELAHDEYRKGKLG